MLSVHLLTYLVLAVVRGATATCYFRNGTATTSDYSPCSSDTSNPLSKVCCASWDTCLPNGLCQSYDKVIWRETCTQKDWDQGGCQELCSNEREAQRNDNIKVTSCEGGKLNVSSTTWCCGASDDCCADGSIVPKYTIARRFGDAIPTPVSSSSTSSPSASASATNSAPATSSSAASTVSQGFSTGAKAGIGIGAALGVVALIALAIFVRKALRWRKAASASAAPAYQLSDDYAPTEVYRYRSDETIKPAQLPGMESEVHELQGGPETSPELSDASPTVTERRNA